ncbi:MAG: DNA-processing protein DprA [Oscillospiraceae bacterium]|jgi:DNA processing protein|nr:DNA-processing protein DprA [Oscillospiraceae bacterium]
MNDELACWVWLGCSIGFGNRKIKAVNKFYNIQEFYKSGYPEWESCGFLDVNEVKKLKNFSINEALEILFQCKKLGIKIIPINSPNYPQMLKNIENPPCVLYIKGDLSCVNNAVLIAVVGTRNATAYGLDVGYNLGFDLADRGVVVVSGGALGVDSAAHKGAINACGKTICVLGCGINHNYLIKNKSLREKISSSGALVSEYPPNYPPTPYNFPLRNRIISGLSSGVVVVEAGKKSGSLITANIALEQNRDVFSVPGNIKSWACEGTNYLIKSGAKPVLSVEDIIEEYELFSAKFHKHENLNQQILGNFFTHKSLDITNKISSDSFAVLNVLSCTQMNLDDICVASNLSIQKVLSAITELEVYNLIRVLPGKKYLKLTSNT